MKESIFLSYPKPYLKRQKEFINKISDYLESRNFMPRTLGITDYDMNAPLTAIRRLMIESNGIITIAFRRNLIRDGISKPDSDLNQKSCSLKEKWLTSPYCQIEPAMAFQLGLPILIFREKEVIADGILEIGALGINMPEFDLDDSIDNYFESEEWKQLMKQWESSVMKVVEAKGCPPKLY